jgi:hypothetical protein
LVKGTPYGNATEVQLGSTLRTGSLYHQIDFLGEKIVREGNSGNFMPGQTESTIAKVTVKMYMEVYVYLTLAIVCTKGVFGNSRAVIDLVGDPVLDKGQQGPVQGGPVRFFEVVLQIRKAYRHPFP